MLRSYREGIKLRDIRVNAVPLKVQGISVRLLKLLVEYRSKKPLWCSIGVERRLLLSTLPALSALLETTDLRPKPVLLLPLSGVRKNGGWMPTRKDAHAKVKTSGAQKTEPLDLSSHALVLAFEGPKIVKDGPYKGERCIGTTRVYLRGKLIGLLNKVEFSQSTTEPLPQVEFTFTTSTVLTPALSVTYKQYVDEIREAMPWATITSPIGNYGPDTNPTVFDPGTIKPQG